MAGRRAVTEGMLYEDEEGSPIDLNMLKDEEMTAATALAYQVEGEDESGEEEDEENENQADSDIDDIDF